MSLDSCIGKLGLGTCDVSMSCHFFGKVRQALMEGCGTWEKVVVPFPGFLQNCPSFLSSLIFLSSSSSHPIRPV